MNKGHIIATGSPLEIITTYSPSERLKVTAERALYDYVKQHTDLNAEYDDATKSLVIQLRSKSDAISAFETIAKSNLEWSDLSTERDSLEDIFIKLVGVRLDEGEPVPNEAVQAPAS